MSSVFIVDNTDGTLSLVMEPGSLNGPGSGTRDSDLRLYGMGTLLWGEGVNENILRISENWACDEKAGTPGTPQDEIDLGPGRGITTPLEGQTWWNKTIKQMYAYDGAAWKTISALYVSNDPTDNPSVGDLWYDTDVVGGCMEPVVKIYDPTHPEATPQGWVNIAADRLNRCGDAMSGDLDMTNNSILNLSYPSNPGDAASKQYVDDRETSILASLSGHATDMGIHLTANQNLIMDNLESNLSGNPPATMGVDLSKMRGFNSGFGGNTVTTEMNNRIRKNATDTMAAAQTIVLGRDPNTGTMEAATASWVETQIGATGASGGDRIVKYWNTLSGSAQDGDIHVDGTGKIWIRALGAWEQVFPAQYS